jgi:hypothetical protein
MRQLFIDSRDRVSGTSTDFVIVLPETLVVEGGNRRARIDNLRIPLTVPTIRTGVNDTIIVRVDGVSYTAQIRQANYDGIGLAAAIQSALSASAPGTWTVSYDISNIALYMACSRNFVITGGTYSAQLMAHPYTNTATSYNFTYVNVLGIDIMYLSSSKFMNLDTIGPKGAHDTLTCAVVTTEFGSVLDVSMPTDVFFNIPAMTTQQLDFQLRDRNYNILSIVPNISFVLVID